VATKRRQSRETGNIGYTRRRKTKQKHSTICDGHHYTQTNTNNVALFLNFHFKINMTSYIHFVHDRKKPHVCRSTESSYCSDPLGIRLNVTWRRNIGRRCKTTLWCLNYKQTSDYYICNNNFLLINVREYRSGNQEKTIQRNWQHRVHKTKKNKTKT
jgi:hypothetical protein